ncbi:hypothetical protein MNBD_UNCLBAC01-232 [hydrothermal vent metagenome]|uniref:Radical SAM core domain-containing protein n=1 Tax=hydrothermal vent metagenome TaxID=652676 RepID=A0A3B1DJQ0_9ZZZZ
MKSEFKYIYGPVYSWRMGMSLGVDPLSTKSKICNFDCVYCQLGKTVEFVNIRKVFVSVDEVMNEINHFPSKEIDYYTFSGRGEPTLAKNLGEMIRAVKQETGGKVAVITDSALMDHEDVRLDLCLADFVLAKLDACSQESLQSIDVPASGVQYENIIKGINLFKKEFSGRLALQMMFIQENKHLAESMASVARDIGADEIQLNTPLRPSAAQPLTKSEMEKIKIYFQDLPATNIYDVKRKNISPLNDRDTLRRHGNFKKTR